MGAKIKMPFVATGYLAEYITKDNGKLKGIYLETANGTHYIKLSKLLRQVLPATVAPGTAIVVRGEQSIEGKKGAAKLKALVVRPEPAADLAVVRPASLNTSPASLSSSSKLSASSETKIKPKKVLICRKSSCWKRGGRQVWQTIVTALEDAGLTEQVELKATGCMGKCKQGPNVIFSPGKHRFSKVRAEVAADLVYEHFIT
ncbi:MAG: (2Fe-2S) ferredoxin domain-containing protein [Cyanobacteria bacterium J06642_2]